MFGSVTMLFLIPLAFIVNSMWLFGTLSCLVWLLVLLLPAYARMQFFHSSSHNQHVLVYQWLFAAIQAGAGMLIVLGKYC